MNCLPCFGNKNSDNKNNKKAEEVPVAQPKDFTPPPPVQPTVNNNTANNNTANNNTANNNTANNNAANNNKEKPSSSSNEATTNTNKEAAGNTNNKNKNANRNGNDSGHTFTFRELLSATKNFKQESLLGESSFGKVYKGTLQSSGQVVAVKQLDRHRMQGNKEFLVEVMMLSLLHHPNLVNLIGYCADGEQRLLVFEYMPLGSLADHLFDLSGDKKILDWVTRMKIASGAAQAVEYLHEKANPPVIYRNLKSSNILLDEEFNPRLTDYGLAKLEVASGNTMKQRVMGTNGYCAPEYERNGELTLKSDVYCFGVVLLELITGRKALDTSLPTEQQNLVAWAQPYFRDPKRFPELADPRLKGDFPERSLNQAVGVAAMCIQEETFVRPLISDVVAALSFLSVAPPDDQPNITPPPLIEQQISTNQHHENEQEEDMSSSTSNDEDENSGSESQDGGKRKAYDHEDGGGSSSESLYNEDEFSDESQQEENRKVSSIRRASTRSRSKKKVGESTSNVGRKSSRQKSEDDSSVGEKSSRRKRSSFGANKQNSISRRKSSDGEDSDASSRNESHEDQSISSVSKFSLDSRCYSNFELQE